MSEEINAAVSRAEFQAALGQTHAQIVQMEQRIERRLDGIAKSLELGGNKSFQTWLGVAPMVLVLIGMFGTLGVFVLRSQVAPLQVQDQNFSVVLSRIADTQSSTVQRIQEAQVSEAALKARVDVFQEVLLRDVTIDHSDGVSAAASAKMSQAEKRLDEQWQKLEALGLMIARIEREIAKNDD